jgi:plasmid stability protein
MLALEALFGGGPIMPDILVRGLDHATVKRLKARARRHGRSLQGEAKLVLELAAGMGAEDVAALLADWQGKLAGRRFADSAALIREDRER